MALSPCLPAGAMVEAVVEAEMGEATSISSAGAATRTAQLPGCSVPSIASLSPSFQLGRRASIMRCRATTAPAAAAGVRRVRRGSGGGRGAGGWGRSGSSSGWATERGARGMAAAAALAAVLAGTITTARGRGSPAARWSASSSPSSASGADADADAVATASGSNWAASSALVETRGDTAPGESCISSRAPSTPLPPPPRTLPSAEYPGE